MKSLARNFVWWPGMDSDLEGKVKECHPCQVNRKAPPNAPLHPWIWPNQPWSHLHIDHAGPFMVKLFLVVVDAHSKWLEVKIISSTSSQATIHAIFAIHGLPDIIVSDNGTAFTSSEFNDFVQKNGIRHQTHQVTTLPSCIKWSSRKGCTDFQGRFKEVLQGRFGNPSHSILISVPHNSTFHHRNHSS